MIKYDHELILCIVNEGFSDAVMDAARDAGATGGTVIEAHGTANSEAEKLFSISISSQKEIVMIVVPKELRDKVMHALYKEVGLNTPGQGIAFAMPVDNVVGIAKPEPEKEKKDGEDK
ncbi:MAG: P-II family nitrogen regulator [Clostridia bacterium]|nr:P-II family nitrogen regulator [Clostridia bacterium]